MFKFNTRRGELIQLLLFNYIQLLVTLSPTIPKTVVCISHIKSTFSIWGFAIEWDFGYGANDKTKIMTDLPEENHQTLFDNQKRTKMNFYDRPSAGQRFVQPAQQPGRRSTLPVFHPYIMSKPRNKWEKFLSWCVMSEGKPLFWKL